MAEVVVIGAAIIDVLVRPASEAVFHTGSYPAEDITMSPGADAMNEASLLAGLGDSVKLETVIGKDRAGDYLLSCCREKGIELGKECVREGLKTGINVVLVEEDGNRSFLTNKNGSLRSLVLSDIQIPFCEEVKIICFASIFVFPRIGAEELKILFRQARSQGITVCADMTKCKHGETEKEYAEAFSYVDYLFANEAEAMLLTGAGTAEEAAGKLLEAGAGCVIIKCGAKGCYVRNPEKDFRRAARNVDCIDTIGAGDSFVAGFIHMLLQGETIETCAEFANECGAQAVQVMGAGTG